MNELRYSPGALLLDAVRSVAGIAATGLPLALARPPSWLAALLALVLLLFLAHLGVTIGRARRRYLLADDVLRVLPGGTTIDWERLDALHLDYFSTRRDGRSGWMQLRLRAGDARVQVDSSLRGFDALLARAVCAARRRRLELSAATSANLSFVVDEPGVHG
jgi:hypothetical protein